MKSLDILVRRWKAEDLRVLPPYGEAIVRTTFLNAGIKPAKDLIRLYGSIGGMEISDRYLWRLWPLDEVDDRKFEANEFGVLFSDYLFDSCAYRVTPNDLQTSAVYVDYFDGRNSNLVANTLERFFDLYLDDAEHLLNLH